MKVRILQLGIMSSEFNLYITHFTSAFQTTIAQDLQQFVSRSQDHDEPHLKSQYPIFHGVYQIHHLTTCLSLYHNTAEPAYSYNVYSRFSAIVELNLVPFASISILFYPCYSRLLF